MSSALNTAMLATAQMPPNTAYAANWIGSGACGMLYLMMQYKARRPSRADLFAVSIGAPRVRDAHLVNAESQACDIRDDLRLESESLFMQRNLLQQVAPKHLVASRHVRQIEIREHVRQHCEEAIAD